jgi:hypothetical protein
MKLFLGFLLLSLSLFAQNESFSKSKKELRKIHRDHQVTFYCGCKYNYSNKENMIDRDSCGYVPRNEYTKSAKKNERARRIEWEHVIPAENFGRQFSCWRDGDAACVDSKGKAYKGRKCCEKVSKEFRIMQDEVKYAGYELDKIKTSHIHKMLYFVIARANKKCEVCTKSHRELTMRKKIKNGSFTRSNLMAICKTCANKIDKSQK